MIYEDLAKELLDYIIHNHTRKIDDNMNSLSKGEMCLLSYLCQKDGLSAGEISRGIEKSNARIASILNSLEKKGFIRREISPMDRRKIIVYVCSAGRLYLEQKHKEAIENISKMLEQLGEHDAKEHIRIIKRIYEIETNTDSQKHSKGEI